MSVKQMLCQRIKSHELESKNIEQSKKILESINNGML